MESNIRNIVRRALAAHHKHGAVAISKELLRRTFRLGSSGAYQAKLAASEDVRWRMIHAQIPAGSGSLLDIGSNLGSFTAEAARSGLWSVGVELSGTLVRQSQALHEQVSECAFMVSRINLDSCRQLPRFDVILVLSVHHHWHFTYGQETANAMLRAILQKAARAVIFEGPSRTQRYGEHRPNFIDNDEASVTSYYASFLQTTVGDLVSEIRPMGKAACVGDREPHRWMYALIK